MAGSGRRMRGRGGTPRGASVGERVTRSGGMRGIGRPEGRADDGGSGGNGAASGRGSRFRAEVDGGECGGGTEQEDPMRYYPNRFFGSFNTDLVCDLIDSFGEKKISLLREVGLGGLQHLKRGMSHSKNLVFFLYKRLDSREMSVDLGNGNKIILTIESVVKCMGIRGTGIDLEEDDLQLEASVR
jgi:hypothetical protein